MSKKSTQNKPTAQAASENPLLHVDGGESVDAKTYGVKDLPFIAHLTELRNRMIYSVGALLILTAVFYPFSKTIYAVLARPLIVAMGADARLIFTALPEVFLTYLKLSFFAAVMVAFPFILFQLWRFIAPGLYKKEQQGLRVLFMATPLLFYCGAGFVYWFVFPLAWEFFLSFQDETISLIPKVNEYLGLSMKMLFAFGVAFELPVFLYVLFLAGFVSVEALQKGRKYALIIIFGVAAVITPPDIISQIALGVPMVLLYEGTLFFMKRAAKK